MKTFLLRSSIFLLITLFLLLVEPYILLLTGIYKQTVAGAEVYDSIVKSKQKSKAKKILLGDSVGNQLFPNVANNDTINSLTCNQAISMAGHFFLLNNYLNTGNKVDTVFLMYTPSSFQNNLNQIYTYHYFLKPFYIDEYKPLFTKTVNEQIQKIPYSKYCRFSNILTSNWAPDFVSTDTINYSFLSPVSVEYLLKIRELSKRYHFKLIIIPPPLAVKKKTIVDKLDKDEIVNNNLTCEFGDYFKNIIFLDDNLFVSDGIHLKKENIKYYTEFYKNKLIR